jgi:hypothetical protein
MTLSEKTSALNAWHRADLILKHLEQTDLSLFPFNTFLTQPFAVYAYLSYALVFTVLDFLKEKNSIPPSIEAEVSAHWDNLRLFRNAVFHIQDEVVSPKTMALAESKLDVKTVSRLHHEVGRFLEQLSPTT